MMNKDIKEIAEKLNAIRRPEDLLNIDRNDYQKLVQYILKLENDVRTLQKAIHRVRTEAIHGLYGEAPETTLFENALYDLYGLVPWEVGEALEPLDSGEGK